MKGRKVAHEFYEFYKKYVPGYQNAEQIATSALMGVRESRRIVGEYELCYEDMRTLRVFPDQIGVFRYHIDIHPYKPDPEIKNTTSSKTLKKFQDGEHFGIPYSIMVPKGWDNLWVAGRSVSATKTAQATMRVQGPCMAEGQAAGCAAAMCAASGVSVVDIDVKELRAKLEAQGVIL